MPTLQLAQQLKQFAEEILEISKGFWIAQSRTRGKEPLEITETEFLALDILRQSQPLTVGDIQRQIGVLNTNIQQAQQEGNLEAFTALQHISDTVFQLLEEMMPPEFRLVDRLANAEDDGQVRALLEQERERLDADFLSMVEQAVQDLGQEGHRQGAERLRYAAGQIKEMLGAG